jgi:hypothetical protein
MAAMAALVLALRDAPSPPAAPAAGPTLVPLARADDAPEPVDRRATCEPPAPAPSAAACPERDPPAPPAASVEPSARHRTRAAVPRPSHRLPPLGL